jgi:deoxycytidine triphosphate deaminase
MSALCRRRQQRGYVAGLIDGQGYVGIVPPTADGFQAARLAFMSPNRTLLENMRSVLGTGVIAERLSTGPHIHELLITRSADIQYILSQVFPYLTDKHSSAAAVLDHLKTTKSIIVDPKHFDPQSFIDFKDTECIIPPNSFALARTIEYFRIPRGVLTICVGKSTYARCGIIVNVTPFEPEWEGFVTLEISNTRGDSTGALFRGRRGMHHLIRRQEGQISESAGDCPSKTMSEGRRIGPSRLSPGAGPLPAARQPGIERKNSADTGPLA